MFDVLNWRSIRLHALKVAVLVLLSLSGARGFAQVTTADVNGTVTDASGAVLPSATVTIRNLDTQELRTTRSSDSGTYTFTLLNPGNYEVDVAIAGFKQFQGKITLAAGDRARVDTPLVVGSQSETVDVTTMSPALQTDSSTLASTVTEKAVQDLPLNGRNFVNLAQLVPGANEGPANSIGSGNRPDDRRPQASVSVNGQSEIINNQMVDGIDNNDRLIGTIAVRPSVEAIAEVRVLTNDYTPELGRTAGGVINVITKFGTNQLHGTAYEFFRNDVLNANPFIFGATNPATGQPLRKPELRQNQFGASIGGPIRKDHTFFFGDYEGFRLIQGQTPTAVVVPTLYEEQHPGDFTDIGGTKVTPTDPVGLDYFKLFPAPNASVNGTPEYVGIQNKAQFGNTYDVRVDHNITAKDLSYARFTWDKFNTFFPGVLPAAQFGSQTVQPGGNYASYPGNALSLAYSGALNYTHLFTSTLLAETKLAYVHLHDTSTPLNAGQNPNTAVGQPGVNLDSTTSGLAPVVLSGIGNLGNGGYTVPLTENDNSFQLIESVSYVRGTHSMKTGISVIYRRPAYLSSNSGEGVWTFASVGALNPYQALLTGNFTGVQRNYSLAFEHYRTWEWGAFVQDDWKVSPKLTLNYGARWDLFTPFTEAHHQLSTFNPYTGLLQVADVNGVSDTAGISTDYGGYAPRVGFAYTPRNSFVVRGGYGMSYFPNNYGAIASEKNQPFVSNYGTCTPTTCPAGFTTLAEGLPAITPTSATSPTGSISSGVDTKFGNSYLEQFNLTLQKDAKSNVITLSYVGMLGRHLRQQTADFNAAPPNTDSSAVANTLRPYYATLPNITTISTLRTVGSSNYNSVQFDVLRRTKAGLTFDFNYTLAHLLDNTPGNSNTQSSGDGFGDIPSQSHSLDYGNGDLDIRDRVVGTLNYELPGKNLQGLEGIVAKGWQFNMIGVWNTGEAFTVTNGSNVSNARPGTGNTDRPNVVGTTHVSNPGIATFFNKSAFEVQQPGTLGEPLGYAAASINPNPGPLVEERNMLYGPHQRRLDISLFKTFPITERLKMEFRAEMFNTTNTTNFNIPNNSFNESSCVAGAAGCTGTPSVTDPARLVKQTNSAFGSIQATIASYNPRLAQFAVKFLF